MKLAVQFLAVIAAGVLVSAAPADPMWRHRLTVAAHPDLGLDNAEIDDILSTMNATIRVSSFGNPWDPPCPRVEFVRAGDLIQPQSILQHGTFEELTASLRTNAPRANVLVVGSINCGGIQAAGCGRIGAEPLIVGLYPNFDAQLWLHERGHTLGLQHSAENPESDTSVPPQVGMRFMFWMLGLGHMGKTSTECAAFMAPKFKSVAKINQSGSPAIPAPKSTAQVAVTMPTPVAPTPVVAPALNPTALLDAEASRVGLTPNAFRAIGPPWAHGLPIDAIKMLTEKDLESIRAMMRGSINQYWPQAVNALAVRGDASDLTLITKALSVPVAAVARPLDKGERAALRTLVQTKLSAPVAIGILANRTQSAEAVNELKKLATMDVSRTRIGEQNAAELSKQALHGLSLANTVESAAYLKGVLEKPVVATAPKIAPLSIPDAARLKKNNADVIDKGIEAYLKQRTVIERNL